MDVYRGPPPGQYVESPTVYELDFTAVQLPAGATANGAIQIQADSDFKLIKTAALAIVIATDIVESLRVVPMVSLQITDTGSGRNLFNQVVPVTNVFGTGQLPFIWPVPYVFQARSSMAVVVTNFDTTDAYNLRLSFIGTKLFRL